MTVRQYNDILFAVAKGEAQHYYAGRSAGKDVWAMEIQLSPERVNAISAWFEKRGYKAEGVASALKTAAAAAGAQWKSRNRTLAFEILLLIFGGLFSFMLIEHVSLFCLVWTAVIAFYGVRTVKNHRSRKLVSLWKNGGSVEECLNRMEAALDQKVLPGHIALAAVFAVLAIPFLMGVADGKLYPYLMACKELDEAHYAQDYVSAARAFEPLGDYRDSKEKFSAAWIAYGDEKMEFSSTIKDAFKAYERAGAKWKIGEYYYQLAEKALEKGDAKLALSHFKEAAKYQYSDSTDRLNTLGTDYAQTLWAEENVEGALNALRQVSSYEPARKLLMEYAQILWEKGDDQNAERALRLLSGDEAAQELLFEILEFQGDRLMEEGQYEASAEKYAEIFNENGYLSIFFKASDAYVAAGDEALARRDWEEAIRLYKEAHRTNVVEEARYQQAVYYYENGDLARAAEVFALIEDHVFKDDRMSVAEYLEKINAK